MARPQAAVGAPREPAETSDHRTRLVALRDLLEGRLLEAATRDTAPLAARYQAVLAELAAMPAPAKGSTLDDLTARRASRRSKPAAS